MTEVELELTYLAKTLPNNLKDCPSKTVVDVYFPDTVDHPVVRLRQNGNKYELTKKSLADGHDSSKLIEETIHLTAEEFAGLATARGRRVVKQRYRYPFGDLVAEIDVFQEALSGLVIIDFEFPDRDMQMSFAMPDFCLADVTQLETTAGGMLAGKSYADIKPTLHKLGYKPLYL